MKTYPTGDWLSVALPVCFGTVTSSRVSGVLDAVMVASSPGSR